MDKSYVKYLEDINIAILDIKSHLENSKLPLSLSLMQISLPKER